MRRLIVKNIGPIKFVDISLNRVNVFCGPQGSGKSTIAKIISFCTWLEKNNDSTLKVQMSGLIDYLKSYHHMNTYFSEDSSLLYSGDNLVFAYNCNKIPFDVSSYNRSCFRENEVVFTQVQKAKNPKVIYIPADRNFVASVPNLKRYAEDDDSLQGFVNDWFDAKRHYTTETPLSINPIGVKYYYNAKSDMDYFVSDKGDKIQLREASSGFQSIGPLYVMLDWMASRLYETNKPFSPEEDQQIRSILDNFSGSTDSKQIGNVVDRLKGFISGKVYTHTQFIIEEPEQNLFPQTQRDLLYRILEVTNHGRNHHVVITTHSPYVLYALNNAMLAYLVKDSIPQEVSKNVTSMNYCVNPSDISVWEISEGEIRNIQDVKNNNLIRNNYFNQVMRGIMGEFNSMLDYYE